MVPIINKYHSLSHYVLTSKYSCKISTTYWEQEKYFSKLTCPHLNKCTTYLTCTDHKLACPKKTGNKNYWVKGWTHKQVCGQYKLIKLCTCAPVNERVRFLTLKTHFQKPLKEECFFEDVLKCDYEKFCIISWFFFLSISQYCGSARQRSLGVFQQEVCHIQQCSEASHKSRDLLVDV